MNTTSNWYSADGQETSVVQIYLAMVAKAASETVNDAYVMRLAMIISAQEHKVHPTSEGHTRRQSTRFGGTLATSNLLDER